MHLAARAAAPEDLDEATALLEAAAEEAGTERGGPLFVSIRRAVGPSRDVLARQIGQTDSLVALGLVDQVPLALAVGRLGEPFDGQRLVSLEVLYVDPAARAVGLGEELLGFVTEWAGRRGAAGIDVRVLPGAREAKSFFESSGYVARTIVMHRRLEADQG